MRKREFPSAEVLKSRLSYSPDTGELTWKERPLDDFSSAKEWKRWSTMKPGKVAGSKMLTVRKSRGCLAVAIDGHPYSAHRIIWTMLYGPMESHQWIDHINGDPWDNRLCNLRLTDNTRNQWNRGAPKNSTSGVKGVTWNKKRGMWKSHMRINSEYIHLGYHATKGMAALVVAKKSLSVHGKHSLYCRKSASL